MTDRYVITQDDLIDVEVDHPVIDIVAGNPEPVSVVLVQGAQGPAGPNVEFVSTTLTGCDDTTTVFDLPEPARFPSQINVYRNGLRENLGIGFTATATSITFSTAPLTSDVVAVFYERF